MVVMFFTLIILNKKTLLHLPVCVIMKQICPNISMSYFIVVEELKDVKAAPAPGVDAVAQFRFADHPFRQIFK